MKRLASSGNPMRRAFKGVLECCSVTSVCVEIGQVDISGCGHTELLNWSGLLSWSSLSLAGWLAGWQALFPWPCGV